MLQSLRPELTKVSEILSKMLRHKVTYATAAVAVILALIRFYQRENNRNNAVGDWLKSSTQMLSSPTNSSSTLVKSQSLVDFQRLASPTTTTTTMKRSSSRTVLDTFLRRSDSQTSLCSSCLTRASSHNSLAILAHKMDEFDALNQQDIIPTPGTPLPHPHSVSHTHSHSHSHSHTLGPHSGCVVCESERITWATYVKRIFYVSAATTTTYLCFLRFIASRETAFNHFAAMVRGVAYLYKYKVVGDHVIPRTGPAIVTVYHGYIPLDMYFFQEHALRNIRKDAMVMVADFVFNIPLLGYIIELGGGVRANPVDALAHLKRGGLLIVAPGGVREAMTPTVKDYFVGWGGRSGFAKLARDANAPIIPMFTRNIREVFLVLGGDNAIVKWLYNKTKLPFTFFLGPFLLPLTSLFGSKIGPFDASTSIARISKASQDSLQLLMSKFSK